MSKAFTITGLTKAFKGFNLGPLDLSLEAGMTMGLIGPNGAGKTTTLNCMMGLVKRDGGSVEISGKPATPDTADWKLDVGYVSDEPAFYEGWTGLRNLRFIAEFYPTWSAERAESLARRFDLPLDKKVRDLSRGNRMKLALVSALAHSPALYLFDEPTMGLDPVVHSELLETLWELLRDGRCAILFSTHNMGDVAKLADELAFLDNGKLKLRTTKDDLTDRWRRISFRLAGGLESIDAAASSTSEGENHQVISYDFEATRKHLHALNATGITETRLSLDEIAVQVIKGGRNVETR